VQQAHPVEQVHFVLPDGVTDRTAGFVYRATMVSVLDALNFHGICCTKCNEVEQENRKTEITVLVYIKVR